MKMEGTTNGNRFSCNQVDLQMCMRPLKEHEMWRAAEQPEKRTIEEDTAYSYLPSCIRGQVKRNVPVALGNGKAYYPDFIMTKERIIIEIDGGYHNLKKNQRRDKMRDETLMKEGFLTIRIKNEDTDVKTAFLERLVEGFSKIEPVGERESLPSYIGELNRMIAEEMQRWLDIDYIDPSDPTCNSENKRFKRMMKGVGKYIAKKDRESLKLKVNEASKAT